MKEIIRLILLHKSKETIYATICHIVFSAFEIVIVAHVWLEEVVVVVDYC